MRNYQTGKSYELEYVRTKEIHNLISDGYIVTENAQYPLYDAEDNDISMVV